MVSELVKCCSRRMFRFEAVLVVDRRYVIGDVGEDDFFKEFGCWGQEGNGSIGGALVGIFAWFGNRYYVAKLIEEHQCELIADGLL